MGIGEGLAKFGDTTANKQQKTRKSKDSIEIKSFRTKILKNE
jgi:hypothetical protein